MFSKMLVGVDGGPGGNDAIALARHLADNETRLVLANVWHGLDGVVAAALGRTPPAEVGHAVLERAAWVMGARCTTLTWKADSVAEGLHRAAEHEGCDLIVVGSRIAHRPGRTLLSDDIRAALHGAPCGIAVAPGEFRLRTEAAFRRVGVGYEATAEGREALAAARAIAAEQDAELRAIAVVGPVQPVSRGAYGVLDVLRDVAAELEDEARLRLKEIPDCDGVIAQGGPTEQLTAASEDLDLLVLGSRGYGPVRRLLLGSTSEGVLKDAACPVLVVPRRGATADEARDATAPGAALTH